MKDKGQVSTTEEDISVDRSEGTSAVHVANGDNSSEETPSPRLPRLSSPEVLPRNMRTNTHKKLVDGGKNWKVQGQAGGQGPTKKRSLHKATSSSKSPPTKRQPIRDAKKSKVLRRLSNDHAVVEASHTTIFPIDLPFVMDDSTPPLTRVEFREKVCREAKVTHPDAHLDPEPEQVGAPGF